MSKPSCATWPIDHPEILAIGVDVTLRPSRRAHYSELVLMLADAAIEHFQQQLTDQKSLKFDISAPPPSGSV
jgi:hypothetical protein